MSTNADGKPVMEVELKAVARDTSSGPSESGDKIPETSPQEGTVTRPPLQLRPPLPHGGDSKSSGGWSTYSTPDPSPMLRSSESSEPANIPISKHLSANYTPSWRVNNQSRSTESMDKTSDDTHPASDEHHAYPQNYAPGIAEGEDERSDTSTPTDFHNLKNDIGESAILEDLERKTGFGALGGAGTDNLVGLAGFTSERATNPTTGVAPNNTMERGRSASIMAAPMDLQHRTRMGRKMSQESIEYMGFEESRKTPVRSTLRCCVRSFFEVVYYLTPHLYQRLNIYLLVFFMLVISFLAREGSNALALLRLFGSTVVLEFGCSMADRAVYKLVDVVFESHFDVAYQLHSLNGPLGLIVAIFIMREYWNELGLNADEVLPQFENLLTALAVIVICLAGKNWLTRKQYITLLENRFTAKVENLNTMIIILSELASTRPPKSVQLQRATQLQKKTPNSLNSSGIQNATGNLKMRVKNVFADIVENTMEEETQEEVITRRELYRKRRSFWQSAARLNATAGRMKVITYNGIVNIHNQAQAKEFGRKLFKHLSKGGKVVITPELIRKLFEERREIVNRDLDEKAEHDLEMAEVATGQASKALYENEGEASDLWARAATMFDPFNLGRISEDFCVEAVLNIYKEQRFTAASISDFGELHQSLRIGIDIVYWIVMMFVLQGVFGFDITTYILPFITILLTFSFAVAALAGNLFLAFAFVFFMSPYDVGHKVQFGLMNVYTPPVIGHVKSVTLLYTIVTSTKGETVKIPNHTLFLEKIFNYTETGGAVQEFIVAFNIYGKDNADFEKIKLFMGRLKHYTLRESKEWKSFSFTAAAMDTPNNTMEYRVNCTHREGWGFSNAVAAAKIEYYAMIRKLSEDLGLHYIKANQPVSVATVSEHENDVHTHAYASELQSFSHENELRQRSNALPAQLNPTPLGSPTTNSKKEKAV